MSIEMLTVGTNLVLTLATIMNHDNAVNAFVHHHVFAVVTETTTHTDAKGDQETTTVTEVEEHAGTRASDTRER